MKHPKELHFGEGLDRREMTRLTIMGLLGTTLSACTNRDDSERTSQSEQAMEKQQDSFTLATFNPRDGVVIDRRIVSPEAKNVIVLPDIHPLGPDNTIVPEGIRAQVELFSIIKDLIKQYTVSIVQENFLKNMTLGQFLEIMRQAPQDGINYYQPLKALLETNDQSRREHLAESLIRETVMGAGLIAAATYNGRCNILGTVTPEQLHDVQLRIEEMNVLGVLQNHPEMIPCDVNGGSADAKISVAEAMTGFQDGILTPENVNCYCSVRAGANEILKNFAIQRYVLHPKLEVQAALEAPGKVVIIIAGAQHTFGIRQLLGKNEVNYAVICATSTSGEVREAAFTAPTVQLMFDDSEGTCDALEERQQAAWRKKPQR